MSSNSSMARPAADHCIWSSMFEKAALSLSAFLISSAAHVGVFAVFKEARALMLTDELDERRGVRLPVLRESLRGFRRRC